MFRRENYSELIMKQFLDLAFALSEEHQGKVESNHELLTILL